MFDRFRRNGPGAFELSLDEARFKFSYVLKRREAVLHEGQLGLVGLWAVELPLVTTGASIADSSCVVALR